MTTVLILGDIMTPDDDEPRPLTDREVAAIMDMSDPDEVVQLSELAELQHMDKNRRQP